MIPGLGRSPREGNGKPLQCSCLENPMDRGPGGLWFMGLQRVGHTCTFHLRCTRFYKYSREGNGTPLQYSCVENPMDGGPWWAAVHGVVGGQTRLSDFTFTHWRRKWQPTPVFLPGESQGQGSLVVCRLWGRTELDTTEVT